MTELVLASGPARYLGGSIETFALPYGAFIVIALVLYYIFRRPHSVPRMKYLTPAHQTSVGTREPGTVGVITFRAAQASAPAAEAPSEQPPAPETPEQTEAAAEDPAGPAAEDPLAPAAGDRPEGDA